MKFRPMLIALVATSVVTIAAAQPPYTSSGWRDPGQSRQSTRDMVEETLNRLYSLEPSARRVVRESGFYAVFDVGPDGNGPGMVIEDSIREETLMGVQTSGSGTLGGYRQVWVFQTPKAYRLFVAHGHAFADGTHLQPNVSRSAQQWPPGALEVADDITVYHIGPQGLQREVTMPASTFRRNIAFDRGSRD